MYMHRPQAVPHSCCVWYSFAASTMPKPRTKVVLRRLPQGLTQEVLIEALQSWERFDSHARLLYVVGASTRCAFCFVVSSTVFCLCSSLICETEGAASSGFVIL